MAARSPSPNPSRPSSISSSNPKSPDHIRRSATKDLRQRNPVSKPGGGAAAATSPRTSFEHRENEKDANCSKRARSPVMSSSLKGGAGAKSFMAPTISAASKAIAPSPRRKILGERNEVVRSSLDSLPPDSFDSPATKEEVLAKSGGRLGGLVCCGELNNHSKMNLDDKNQQSGAISSFPPTFKLSPPAIAPLDADPSLPPYDPQTNYLSPRPRFLHYRPNPRIEHYRHGELDLLEMEDGKRLDDSFSSESSRDIITTGQFHEEESCRPLKDCEEQSSQSCEWKKECDDDSACSEVQPLVDADGNHALESEPACKSNGNGRYFLLVLVTACLFLPFFLNSSVISSSTIMRGPALQVINDTHIREYVAVSTVNIKKLASSLVRWLGTTLTTSSSEHFGPFLLANLSIATANQKVEADYSMSETMFSHKMISRSSEQLLMQDTRKKILETQENESKLEVEVSGEDGLKHELEKRDDVEGDVEECGSEMINEDGIVGTDGTEADNKVEVEAEDEQVLSHDLGTEHGVVEAQEDSFAGSGSQKKIREHGQAEMDVIDVKNTYIVEAGEVQDLSSDLGTVEHQDDIIMESGTPQKVREHGLTDIEVREVPDLSSDLGTVEGQDDVIMESGTPKKVREHGLTDIEVIEVEKTCVEEVGTVQDPFCDLEAENERAEGEQDAESQNSASPTELSGTDDSYSESGDEYETLNGLNSQEFPINASEGKSSQKFLLGMSSCVLLLAASLIFLSKRQKQAPVEAAHGKSPPMVISRSNVVSKSVSGSSESYALGKSPPMVISLSNVVSKSASGSSESYAHTGGSPYQSTPVSMPMFGDSGASEFSSSLQQSSSIGRRRTTQKDKEESLSLERRLRRDSGVSSSSISYGSFTTYERLSAKKAIQGEDAMTPVRRSSRIRNQITSP